MKVKSFFTDVGGADRVTKRREQLFDSASPKEDFSDPINKVAKELHPDPLDVKVTRSKMSLRPPANTRLSQSMAFCRRSRRDSLFPCSSRSETP
jgi:hypothetical protein